MLFFFKQLFYIELTLLYSEGYSYKEIAEITGKKFNSVGKTLSRIMDKIKKQMQ